MLCKRLSISTLATLAAFGAAQAADYSQPPQPYFAPPPVIEEFFGGYLRGDIGFSNQSVGHLFSADYANFTSVTNTTIGFDSAPLFGLGLGYTINNWLRVDVTGEYRGAANFHGLDVGALPGGGFADDRYTASKSEWTFLLNGYVDLGTWYKITPFVGAGIGFSRNTISNFGDVSVCLNSNSCAGFGGSDAFGATASQWNFAWAVHAGLAYSVTKNFTVELAYRYIDLGDATTGAVTPFPGGCSSCTPLEFHHLTSHDVKLGLRFNFDAFFAQPQPIYYQPPPLQSRG
jgi:opacity protein-like surface antigen